VAGERLYPEYTQASRFNHEPKRTRKLLVHKREAARLAAAIQREGMTLIPLKMYFNAKGKAKLELGIAKGKKLHDKRETEKQRDWQRDKARLMRTKGLTPSRPGLTSPGILLRCTGFWRGRTCWIISVSASAILDAPRLSMTSLAPLGINWSWK
jgi:hypothetical protein